MLALFEHDRWVAWAQRALADADRWTPGHREPVARPPRGGGPASLNQALEAMTAARRLQRRAAYREATREFTRARLKLRAGAREFDPRAGWLLAWCRLWEAHSVYESGVFARALRHYAAVSRTMESYGDERGLAVAFRGLGNVCKFLGLYVEAVEHYEHSIALSRACADRSGLAATEHNQGNVLLALGDIAEAEEAYRRALTTSRQIGRRDLVHHCWVSLAATAQAAGHPREALRRLTRAGRNARFAAAGFEAERFLAIGVAETGLRRESEAQAALARALELAASVGENHIQALALEALAALHLQSRRPEAAIACAERGLALTRQAGAPTELGGALHKIAGAAAGQSGAWRDAARHFESALHEHQRLAAQRQVQRVRSLALLAQLRQMRQEAEIARQEIVRLQEALTEVATRLRARETHSTMPALERVSAASLRRLGLSPRASEVLHWVVQGKTNDEIAIILGCGAETVKTHLKRVYQQLDVTNRAAAAVRAVEFTASAAAGS